MNIKVCIISGAYPPIKSGMADYTEILAKKLIKLGVDLKVITSKQQKIQISNCVLPIISEWDVFSLLKILKILKEIGPSIVHIQYPTFGYGRNIAINILPILIRVFFREYKIVISQHEFSIYSVLGKLRSSIHLLFAHRITTTTTRNLHEIMHFLPPLKRKILYIPIASNIQTWPLRQEKKVPFTICYFGLVRPQKGLETLIQALSRILNRRFLFLLIGELNAKCPYHQKIMRFLKETRIIERTQVTGHCSGREVSKLLVASDVCVLPFSDGVSERRGSFLAALQHKVPVITTKGAFTPNGLADRVNVKLVNSQNSEELAVAIQELMDNEELRNRIAEGGYEWSKQFSWDHIAAKNFSMYLELLNRKNI